MFRKPQIIILEELRGVWLAVDQTRAPSCGWGTPVTAVRTQTQEGSSVQSTVNPGRPQWSLQKTKNKSKGGIKHRTLDKFEFHGNTAVSVSNIARGTSKLFTVYQNFKFNSGCAFFLAKSGNPPWGLSSPRKGHL